jgi:very-short-patch-repair endonuclease
MPVRRTTPKIRQRAKELRHAPTPAEAKLWLNLRANQLNGHSFRRQHAIGPFITDFCCIKGKLVIELDGGQHVEQEVYDLERTAYLQSRGYHILRFWNDDVMKNIDRVVEVIVETLEEAPLSPPKYPDGHHVSSSIWGEI